MNLASRHFGLPNWAPAFAGEQEGDLPLQFKWAAPILGQKPWALVYKKMRCNRKKRHENEAA